SSKPINHEDTSVSPIAEINENDLDCVIIPEISSRKRKLYTDDASGEVGDNVSELSSEETGKEKAIVSAAVSHSQLRKQPSDPFHKKNTDSNNDTPNVSVGSSKTTTRKKTSGSLVRSPAWKWFEEVYIDNIRHG
ncbi:7177_t:CDS:2, partial [Gigaspora rosea]